MPNYKQAPKLYHNKDSFKSTNYYNLPQGLMDCIFEQLTGQCGNQIKIMTVLLGTLGDGSFGVSEAWICKRTGMVQQTYSTARKALVDRGWIYLEDGNMYVLPKIIRYGFNYPQGATKEEREQIKKDTISNCVNELKKQHDTEMKTQYDIVPKAQYEIVPKTQCEIVYNKINNKEENKKNISIGLSSPDGSDNPIHSPSEEEIEGEIDKATADRICDKTVISPSLILTSTGKYFRVRG